MRLACVGYRDWALKIYDQLAAESRCPVLIIRNREQYDDQLLKDFKPNLILFYGWSWKVGPEILKLCDCLMLHPSPLPKYRGGSPIQNQIIEGETQSAVSIFVMSEGMDDGDIVAQETISLDGDLAEILERMTAVGLRQTREIIAKGYVRKPQNPAAATYCKRRKPEDSEITLEEIQSKTGRYLYDKIRMLQDPYPNAYVRTADGKKLFLSKASLGE